MSLLTDISAAGRKNSDASFSATTISWKNTNYEFGSMLLMYR